MRTAPHIVELWNKGGPFIGNEGAPCGRATVEIGWMLHTSTGPVGSEPGNLLPVRWFQRADNAQVETEIPNVKTIDTDDTIDKDAATATITITNQKMNAAGVRGLPGQLGNPGWLSPSRGRSPIGQVRWNHTPNTWQGILEENALIRTYQGYGGKTKTIEQAITDGNIIQTGTWLIDDATVAASGDLTLACRNMAKLLIEQYLYPPLVPASAYPLRYQRFIPVNFAPVPGYSGGRDFAKKRTVYDTSGSDVWYGPNAAVHGHRPSESLDGDPRTFWLSVGNSGPAAPYAVEWIQYLCGEEISAVYIAPWAGNYQCFVSILEDGHWVDGGHGTIAYDPAGVGLYTGANAASIPYVSQFGVPWESGGWYKLPRAYRAAKVRLTFTNLAKSQWGAPYYRAGVREVVLGVTDSAPATKTIMGLASLRDDSGYWLAGTDGGVFTYGHAIFDGSEGGKTINAPVVGIARTDSGNGYWLAAADGGVFAFGDATYYGSLAGTTLAAPIVGIARWRNNPPDGYYLIDAEGGVFTFGGAYHAGDHPPISAPVVGMATTPSGGGYWIVTEDGGVFAFGDAEFHGSAAGSGQTIVGIAGLNTQGYWLATDTGQVFAYGLAAIYPSEGGDPAGMVLNAPVTGITATSTFHGYWLVAGDGGVFAFGDAPFHGSLPGLFTEQFDGNYKDYADIAKQLLLWAGWWFYKDSPPAGPAEVFGNIELTGSYNTEGILDETVWDTKPVIDGITTVKEPVGYIFYVDYQGAAHYESPNWWGSGNFLEDGTYTDHIPEIDELIQLTDYQTVGNDKDLKSELILTTDDPTIGFDGTVTTRFIPSNVAKLRGQVRTWVIPLPVTISKHEQEIMAELVGLQLWFAQRQGTVTAAANPTIGINDQVRIFERVADETYIHYVRGVSTHMDLESGEYTMKLTTHWLGDRESWAITADPNSFGNIGALVDPTGQTIQMSAGLLAFLQRNPSRATSVLRNIAQYINTFESIT